VQQFAACDPVISRTTSSAACEGDRDRGGIDTERTTEMKAAAELAKGYPEISEGWAYERCS